ncbi:MAG: ABC transporter ATP-binding protein [Victivallales bacterium]|jgi:ABC-type lipoprotein export system ATPase subunit
MKETIIRLENVCKTYPVPDDDDGLKVLREITVSIDKAQTVAITGPSGSGKTTLLNMMSGLDVPNQGRISVAGRELTGMCTDDLALFRNRNVGFVFQAHCLLPQCTVIENVLLPSIVECRENGDAVSARAHKLLKRVGLERKVNTFPGKLSGGECQRVAVVRALINQPKIIMADEPTGSLDTSTATVLAKLLIELNEEYGTTLVVVTHSDIVADLMRIKFKLENGMLEEKSGG